MNEKKRTVVAVGVVSMLLVLMFFVPWRLETSDQIQWAPAYRPPATHSQTYATNQPGARYAYPDAEVDFGLLALEILAIGIATGVAFAVVSKVDRDEESSSH